jgi:hypothetical protein
MDRAPFKQFVKGVVLKRNLCLGSRVAHKLRIAAKKSLKNSAALELLASTKVERATGFKPVIQL